jgi:uncharacterized protein YqjF (DUF2071 family)
MPKAFLTAEWNNLLMANYIIEPSVLKKYLPAHTELDSFNGNCYASLVGFMFRNTRVAGLRLPMHTNFEEVNLRFYVRYKEKRDWKRGVVFMKEIVPRHMITFVANAIYGEKYATHRMTHRWERDSKGFHVEYNWKVGREWNFIKALAEPEASPALEGSEEEFITEHYWGYTFQNKLTTGVYEVTHPKWKVHTVKNYEIRCDTEKLYGKDFVQALSQPPRSVFLAEGSPIMVMKSSKLIITK